MSIRDLLIRKEFVFTYEFTQKSFSRGVYDIFMDIENMKEFVKNSILETGVIIEDEKHGDNSYKCINILNGKLITIPFVNKKVVIIKTIFWSQQPDINEYKSEKLIDKGETDVR